MTLLTLLLAAALGAPLDDPRTGQELLALMRRVPTYRTMTFVQTTKFPGRPDETWYESAQLPGRLRIDMTPLDSQRVAIFRNDSVYSMRIGRPVRGRPFVHGLLLLLGDVFVMSVDSSAAKLTGQGFDLNTLYTTTWEGRRTYVVGAAAGDSLTPQFWVDAERLYTVRIVEREPDGTRLDSRVTAHQRIGNIWVESEMMFIRNDQEIQREIYADIRVNPELNSLIFEPRAYRRPEWIRP
jgi:hypothetical protein